MMTTAISLWRGRIPLRVSMKTVVAEISEMYGVTVADLHGPSRTRAISMARQHAMFVMADQPHLSLPMIGKFFDRDHTTVLHGVRRHKARMEAEQSAGAA